MTDWRVLTCVVMVWGAWVSSDQQLQSESIPDPVADAEKVKIINNQTVIRTSFLPRQNTTSILQRPTPNEHKIICGNVTIEKGEGNVTSYRDEEGKEYRVVHVRKKPEGGGKCVRMVKKSKKVAPGGTVTPMQRRIFHTILSNITNAIPLRWITKHTGTRSNGTGDVPDSEGSSTLWKLWTQPKQAKRKTQQQPYQGEKLKKFLNLFTIVKFDNGECVFDGLKGTCYHVLECQAKGGRPIGPCAKGFGVCCYIERTCGQRTNENCTYFVNDGFPKASLESPRVCALTVEKAHPHVRQLRIDFQMFELRGPNNGTCLADRFIVTGQNSNDLVPDICGLNSGQHVYVDVDDVNGPLNLNMIMMGDMGLNYPRTFRMKVTQLMRDDELLAPRNCLQYHVDPAGIINSFNYQYGRAANPVEATPGYFNNLNYAICVRKERGFCSITYDVEGDGEDRFQMVNVDQGTEGEPLIPPRQAGAEIFNCPDDYIVVNGIRLCGERLNDATRDLDYSRNAPVTDISNGPFVIPVKTNEAVTGRGFYLNYKQNPCQT